MNKKNWFILWVLLSEIGIITCSEILRNPWTRIELENSDLKDISKILNHRDYVIDTHKFEKEQKLAIYASRDALSLLQRERKIFKVQERELSNYPSDGYMSYNEMTEYLRANLENTNNILATIVTIGETVEHRDIWMFQFNFGNLDYKLKRPTVLLVGNIHGNEVVGREMLLLLIEYLINETRIGLSSDIYQMLQNVNVWIIPSLNPDGFERRMRWNANYYDLNRAFPDQYEGEPNHYEPEVQAMIDLIGNYSFILSASMHGGSQVASYPFDGNANHIDSQYSATPEDDLIKWIATQYADYNPLMYNSSFFPGGITNGAAWYILYGGMQDYNYLHGTPEITLELSNDKWPPFDEIETHWNMNREALIHYINISVTNRISGQIVDCEGVPLRSTIQINQEPAKFISQNNLFSKIVLLWDNITIIVNVSEQQSPAYYDSLEFIDMYKVFRFQVDELPIERIQLSVCKVPLRSERVISKKTTPSTLPVELQAIGEKNLGDRLEEDEEFKYHLMKAKQLGETPGEYFIRLGRENYKIRSILRNQEIQKREEVENENNE